MKNFWQKIKKPFFVLAPMYDVTDEAFRAMFVKYSKKSKQGSWPLVLFTEFVSADGLVSKVGQLKLLRELYFTEEEHPIVAQIFGARPENIEKATKLIKELGFDGVDINMGCPDKTIEKQGAGAGLIKKPELAKEIILAAKRGAGLMPVSIKTRLGYNKINLPWLKTILETKPAAMTVHLRTRKEMSLPVAHWEIFPEIVQMAKSAGVIIIGNGDVVEVSEGLFKSRESGADGIMIGRGAFGRPWLFSKTKTKLAPRECLEIMKEQTEKFWELYGPTTTNQKLFGGHQKNFAIMKKHFKAYASGFPGSSDLRVRLMSASNPKEVKKILEKEKISQ